MQPLERIKLLCKSLNKKDYKLALQFIEKRDFDSLFELVDSAIVITKRTYAQFKDDRLTTDLENMLKLRTLVDTYREQTEPYSYYNDEIM